MLSEVLDEKEGIELDLTDFRIDVRTVPHPEFPNRELSILYVNDCLDLPALSFLLEESRSGGRHGQIAGETTHINRAYRLRELYAYLYEFYKIGWQEAEEIHCKVIRNSMLCWGMDNKQNREHYGNQKPVSNDTVNLKLSVWWKFFKHQEKMGEKMKIKLIPRWVAVKKEDAFLQHTQGVSSSQNIEMKEVWRIRVKPSAKKLHYPALTHNEFKALRKQMQRQHIVLEAFVLLMVKTGLRVKAALEFDKDYLKNWMSHLSNAGRDFAGSIPFRYLNKGSSGEFTTGYLPVKTIEEITRIYLNSRTYTDMLYRWQHENKSDEEPLWLIEVGGRVKRLTYAHVKKAFQTASKAMGRTNKEDKIRSHHLRHTYATWYLLDKIKNKDVIISTIGDSVPELMVGLLSSLMGHASRLSTFRYLATAFKMLHMEEENNADLNVTLTIHEIGINKGVQALLHAEAVAEFEDAFEEELYDPVNYAIHSGYHVKK